MTETKAFSELKKGSQEALDWFIRKYAHYVSTIVFNIIGSSMSIEDVEEVSSDVFYALWRNSEKLNGRNLKAWLAAVSRNMAKNKLRQAGKELHLDDDILIIDDSLEKRELAETVKQAVLSMEWPDREIFLRFYYYCQTLPEIAEQMSMNLSTVKTRLRRGRERLREALSPDNE